MIEQINDKIRECVKLMIDGKATGITGWVDDKNNMKWRLQLIELMVQTSRILRQEIRNDI